jgi:hypothetical protein
MPWRSGSTVVQCGYAAAAAAAAVHHLTREQCGFLPSTANPCPAYLQFLTGDTAFFLPIDASDPTAFHYPPELCHFISSQLAVATNASGPVPPSQFATYGMDIPLAAAEAWTTAAMGAPTLMCALAASSQRVCRLCAG